ncbi:hypothetical protein AXW84_11710 [Hymenobacter sp. PAMC 26628]|nr:hypothetical protein AXW84_11710 [Hymenobacter sp. PAMC 26628]
MLEVKVQEVKDLKQFFKHVGGPQPLEDDLDIRRKEADGEEHCFQTFRHRIYLISVYTSVHLNPVATSSVLNLAKPILFFKLLYQILSAGGTPRGATCFYVAFTEAFLAKCSFLAALIADMPFLRLDRATPFELEPEETAVLKSTFDQLLAEYQGSKRGRLGLISTYLQLYLLQIRRIYERHHCGTPSPANAGTPNDLAIAGEFKRLLDAFFKAPDTGTNRSVAFYADKLALHPNYLNAAVKRATGKTAHELLHEHLIALAKMLLSQTRLTVKEITYRLSFREPAHFANFFKRHTATTPRQFRQLADTRA